MSSNGVNIELDSSDLKKGLSEFEAKTMLALKMYGETSASELESYAKANRPWTDRTSRARQGLKGYTENEKVNSIDMCIAHSVDYGIFLEYAHEKKYAILWPTIKNKSNEILKGLKTMMSKIKVR